MKLVCWNKNFYEKYKEVFHIEVYAKIEQINSRTSAIRDYTSTASSYTTYSSIDVYLPLKDGNWKEENNKLIFLNGAIYYTRNVYMRVEDEVADLFSDLKPWIDYSVSWTTTSR